MKVYMLLIFSESQAKHWTRYFDDKAEAVRIMDQATAQGFYTELYKRFSNVEYRRVY